VILFPCFLIAAVMIGGGAFYGFRWAQIANMQNIAQGVILYGGADGDMCQLPPGTAGYVLQTHGAGVAPSWAYVSNVPHPVTMLLTPEMSGGWKFTSDGTGNAVVVTAYHDPSGIGNGSAYATHLSYDVEGETDLQHLDVYCYFQLPLNFSSWQAGTAVEVESWVSTLVGTAGVTQYLYDTTNTVDAGLNGVTQRNATWGYNLYTPAGTYTAGGTIVLKFRITVDTGTRARIGTIRLKYNALW